MAVKPDTVTVWPADVTTLAIDVGGTGLKGSVLDVNGTMTTDRVRIPTPYPCPPETLVENLKALTQDLPEYNRVSVGFPGLVRHGRVWHIPAFSRLVYGGPEDESMAKKWYGFDLSHALAEAFGVPVKVANDADVQGAAVVKGEGFEFVMTLGTGVGTSVFSNGRLLPHMELSHAPFRHGETFDTQLGNDARKTIGNKRWRKRVAAGIQAFDDFLFFDHIYIGGGNAKHYPAAKLPAKATIVPNTAGILGGIKIWEMDYES
ncbi:MAG: ROK family protein [Candidatus Nanopelagicales bacterium]